MQVHNLAIIFGPALFCAEERPAASRKQSQDKGRVSKDTKRKPAADKKTDASAGSTAAEPTHNLAYRMIISGGCVL